MPDMSFFKHSCNSCLRSQFTYLICCLFSRACSMEDFHLELDHNEENSLFYEIHPAVSGETCDCLDAYCDAIT